MGACECENPMEFGYEVNATEKDESKISQNKFKVNNSGISENSDRKYTNYNTNNNPNIVNLESSISDNNRQKNYSNNNHSEGYYNNANDNLSNNNEQPYDERYQGTNALKSRVERSENQNNYYKEQIRYNNYNNQKQLMRNNPIDGPVDDFSRYIFDNINNIRENPQSFIPIIEKAKSNIMFDKKGLCIYKSSVKVALSRGEPAFDEAIEFLGNLQPMKRLEFSPDLVIIPPTNEEEIKDRRYMNEQINEKVQMGIPIKSFWRDIIKDCETCLILMIVDDTGANSGKKRNDILDPSMEHIGIVSKMIGKNFASYITLC